PSLSKGIIGQEIYFTSSGSFDAGPRWCTLWIGPAALSCIHSHIFYASPAQFGPVVAHLETQTVLPTLTPCFGTHLFQTGAFVYKGLCSLAYLTAARGMLYVYIFQQPLHPVYCVFDLWSISGFSPVSQIHSCPLLEHTPPHRRTLER
ncbi:hypothetical protein LDENG_00042000, partial [Lucifuga dentata]